MKSAQMSRTSKNEMSLRDMFASADQLVDKDADIALSTKELLAWRKAPQSMVGSIEWIKFDADWRAALKYIRADAMLKARR